MLVDPVIFEPDAYADDRYRGFDGPSQHPVARRRSEWASWEEMRDRFADRHPYNLWRPEILADYCRWGVLPGDDGVTLACPGVVEASVYLGNTQTDVYAQVATIDMPVTVLRAPGREELNIAEQGEVLDFSKSPTWSGLAARFPRRARRLPAGSHALHTDAGA